jgi:hypothetical protein
MSIEDNFFAKKFQEIEEDISRNLLQFQEIEEELKKLQAKDKMEYDQTSVLSMAEGNIKKSY